MLIFPRWSIWGVTCLGLLDLQCFSIYLLRNPINVCFPIYLLKNPINVCWNPQNSARFSKTFDLRCHMPRFTLKMNIFPSISLETPKMCVEILRTVLISPRQSIWGVTCLGLVEKFMFSHLCPFLSETIDSRGHMPRFTLKMNIFPSISLESP